ncbi:hypothetical protein AUJ84_03515 [Candidatus Pacearchaeota archaeon CG1_02_32_132]|nr:MAG: hypothetical protein AUJ84_03515 [Candidatus Pacearchaeota archaeon CG1_02_32_132]
MEENVNYDWTCNKCGWHFPLIEPMPNSEGHFKYSCSKCGEHIKHKLKCVICGKGQEEKEAKGFIKVYPDNQIEFYSVLCDECKEKKK